MLLFCCPVNAFNKIFRAIFLFFDNCQTILFYSTLVLAMMNMKQLILQIYWQVHFDNLKSPFHAPYKNGSLKKTNKPFGFPCHAGAVYGLRRNIWVSLVGILALSIYSALVAA